MYEILSLGNAKLELFTLLKSQLSFSDFCSPATTIEFVAYDGFLKNNNLMLFRLVFPGYELEARINDGVVFIKRNGLYQHSERYVDNGRYQIAIQWDVGSIGVGATPWSDGADAMNGKMRAVRTPPTVPPVELVRQLRTENLLFNSAYRTADEAFITLLDCLYLCEIDIRRLGGERYIWGKGGDKNCPLDEPEISRFVATFLASHGAARNFEVVCEPRAGNGNLDFYVIAPVISAGLAKIAIEAKKADHKDLASGISKQLPEYISRLGASHGIFLTYWLKSSTYSYPKYTSYQELEIEVLHPLRGAPNIRTAGINLSNGPTPSRV